MSTLRGFGLTFNVSHGRTRGWYIDPAGVKRWTDNDEAVRELPACPCPMCHGSGAHHAVAGAFRENDNGT